MNKLFLRFKKLFKDFGPNEDLINMYLVFMGVRSACLIRDVNLFYIFPTEAKLEIYFKKYPGYARKKHDYPLVCLKNSIVSKSIQRHEDEFTDYEVGLYLGFNCYDQDWSNTRINRYGINYTLIDGQNKVRFYNEVCSSQPDIATITRIKFKAREMTAALKMINLRYAVRYHIEFIPKVMPKRISRS